MDTVSELYKVKNKIVNWKSKLKMQYSNSFKREDTLPYAYPCNNYLEPILSNVIVRKGLNKFTEKYCNNQIEEIKATSLLATKDRFPQLYRILSDCYAALNVENKPEVYVTSKLRGLNALSIGDDNEPIILISRKSVISLPEGELKFMLGHELGHILQKNLMCHTIKGLLDNLNNKSDILGPLISDIVDVPLNQWYRCAEYTSDRAGYLCCNDINCIKSLFDRIGCYNRPSNPYEDYQELSLAHPLIQHRVREIEKFKKEMIK